MALLALAVAIAILMSGKNGAEKVDIVTSRQQNKDQGLDLFGRCSPYLGVAGAGALDGGSAQGAAWHKVYFCRVQL